jgi:hypothetical protein
LSIAWKLDDSQGHPTFGSLASYSKFQWREMEKIICTGLDYKFRGSTSLEWVYLLAKEDIQAIWITNYVLGRKYMNSFPASVIAKAAIGLSKAANRDEVR